MTTLRNERRVTHGANTAFYDAPHYPPSPVEAEARNPELILGGNFEYLPFYPEELLSISQIRGERNAVTEELKDDITFQGLLNPVDVSLVSRELLEEYIDFTNRTWGAEASIAQFENLVLPDDRFPLLKAGHSRHQAILELIAESRLPADAKVMTRISEAKDVFAIVQWQRGENIHSQPPRERTAMALVESYMYGLEKGAWRDEADFVAQQKAQNRNVTKGALDQALKYSRLPARIRNFVLAGEIPYLAGVEMGATTDILTEFVARSAGFDGVNDPKLTAEQQKIIADTVVIDLDILCNRIAGDNLNSTAAQNLIKGRRNTWLDSIKSMRPGGRVLQHGLDFQFADDQLTVNYRVKEAELRRQLAELHRKYSGHDIAGILTLQHGILPEATVAELLADLEQQLRRTQEALGAQAVPAALYDEDLFGTA